ncbi:MAG: hypothetical protein ABEK42_05290, partial [Thiohalorhabdaceae bacterium]
MTTTDLTDVSPVPQLTLLGKVIGTGANQQRVHLARLDFEYAGYSVPARPWEAVTARYEGGEVIRIHRDGNREQGVFDRLGEAGFAQARADLQDDDHDGLLWMRPGNLAQSARGWDQFLEEMVPGLREEGWQVTIDPSFHLDFITPDRCQVEVEGMGEDWFQVGLGFQVAGEQFDLLPLLEPVIEQVDRPEDLLGQDRDLYLPVEGSQWLRLPGETIYPIVRTLFELFDCPRSESGRLPLSRIEGLRLAGLGDSPAEVTWQEDAELRALVDTLRREGGIPEVAPP